MRQFWGEKMNESDLLLLAETALFRGADPKELPELIRRAEGYAFDFSGNEEISLAQNGKYRIGILLSGSLLVYSAANRSVILNRLTQGSLFGVSALYGEKGADTVLRGNGKGRILFFHIEKLEPLWENKTLRTNLIAFLADRIRFLNRKIAALTAPDTEGKLLRYLSQEQDANGKVLLTRSLSELAKSLNMGRASLYRALEKMEQEGILMRNGNTLFLSLSEELSHAKPNDKV